MTQRADGPTAEEIKALSLRIIGDMGPGVISHPHFFDALLYTAICTAKAQGYTIGQLSEHLRKAMAMELD